MAPTGVELMQPPVMVAPEDARVFSVAAQEAVSAVNAPVEAVVAPTGVALTEPPVMVAPEDARVFSVAAQEAVSVVNAPVDGGGEQAPIGVASSEPIEAAPVTQRAADRRRAADGQAGGGGDAAGGAQRGERAGGRRRRAHGRGVEGGRGGRPQRGGAGGASVEGPVDGVVAPTGAASSEAAVVGAQRAWRRWSRRWWSRRRTRRGVDQPGGGERRHPGVGDATFSEVNPAPVDRGGAGRADSSAGVAAER